MKFVCVSKKVETRIEALEKEGKAGMTLANKAKTIIESLASGSVQHHLEPIGSFTKNGEKRIKNCRKYDLGWGYRLITLQRGETVYIPFLGSHDNCQRWLENHRRLKDFNSGSKRTIRVARSGFKTSPRTQSQGGENTFNRRNTSGISRIKRFSPTPKLGSRGGFEITSKEKSARVNEHVDNIEDDHELFKPLTNKDLRFVFSGLVHGAK